jgi:hypothetical protein
VLPPSGFGPGASGTAHFTPGIVIFSSLPVRLPGRVLLLEVGVVGPQRRDVAQRLRAGRRRRGAVNQRLYSAKPVESKISVRDRDRRVADDEVIRDRVVAVDR